MSLSWWQFLTPGTEAGVPQIWARSDSDLRAARLGGLTELSRTTQLNREALYRALSEKGNPRLDTLTKVLAAVGLRVSVSAQPLPPEHS